MKKTSALLALFVLLAACAPQAGGDWTGATFGGTVASD